MTYEQKIVLERLPALVMRAPESWSGISCLVAQLAESMPYAEFEAIIAQEMRDHPGMVFVGKLKEEYIYLARQYKPGEALQAAGCYEVIPDMGSGWERVCALLGAKEIAPPAIKPVEQTRMPKLRLLVVEDDKMSGRMVAANLSRYGDVAVTANYREAIANSMIERPDIIFLDIHYRDDDNDGFDVMRNLTSFNPDQFVVMFSGDNDPLTIYQCLDAGAQGFIAKPFSAAALAHYVNKFLSR